MTSSFVQIPVSLAIVTIFVLLWRARNEYFTQFGNSWGYILVGFACLASGKISNTVLLSVVEQDRLTASVTELLVGVGYAIIILGLLLTAFGVSRWLSGARELSIESLSIKSRNVDLHQRVARDGMLLSTVPAALYRAYGSSSNKSSEIVFENQKIQELLGYAAAEFAADPQLFGKLMHPDDKKRFEETERGPLWNEDSIVVEHRFRHRNGKYRWLRRHLKRVSDDSADLIEWHGCVFDITDLKQAEARLTNFLKAAPDPVITTDDKGKIVLVNAQAEHLYGYSSAELLGQYFHILIPERNRDHHFERFPSYLTATMSQTIDVGEELLGQHKDGTEFPVEVAVSPMESGNEKLLAFAVRDVSARKNIEAQLRQSQKMEAVGQLTGGIAHDFNNMLTIVIGNLQLLQQAGRKDAATSRFTDAAIDASFRAAELVKRLLGFSRREMLAPKTTSINDLVLEIEPLLHPRTDTEKVSLNMLLADDLWLVDIDQSLLENALVNLANNSRDAVDSGGVLTVETSNVVLDDAYAARHSEVMAGEYVMIAMSDNGEGISKDVLPHVFDPFFTTKDIGKGSGLGLSMVYGFVKQSKGHIKIYSEEGHGTTVKIYIPRAKANHADPVRHTMRNKAIPSGNETILLVEDDDGVREIAMNLLSSLGYKVLHADSGREALKLIPEHNDIKLLFTDIVMPGGITGAELARRARTNSPNLKVLYTSGYTATTAIDNGLLERGDDVLSKPYTKEQLAQYVRDVLDRK